MRVRPRHLGFLYPGRSAEDDYPRMGAMIDPPIQVSVVHTSIGDDAHRTDALLDLGSAWRLEDGARQLTGRHIDSAMWACTSGSFVLGVDGARRQARAVEAVLGVPVSSTSLAFAEAVNALGVRRVTVAATYPVDIARLFEKFLAECGISVIEVSGLGILTGVEVGRLGREQVLALATENDRADAEAVLLPDTALHTASWLEALEDACGKPVLTANQVTVWQALRLAGHPARQPGLGSLFA
jgi:maleate cis-trans isomerase